MSNIIPYNFDYLREKLLPWQLLAIFDDIPSTNSYLKEHASSLQNKTLVLANQQSSGRGRFQRQFRSDRDKGIYCSFLLKNYDVKLLTQLSFACALALAISTHDLYSLKTQIKWPNDLLIKDKKLAGILIESLHTGEHMDVVVGFGLNVYHQNFDTLNALSLEDVYPQAIDRNTLLMHFFKTLDQLMVSTDITVLYRTWMVPSGESLYTSIEGIKTMVKVIDIQENGTLLVRMQDGTERSLFNEEIQIQSNL